MRYLVKHVTRYTYTEPIAACHNQVHLGPRILPYQSCNEYRLWVHPTPSFRIQREDYFGNRVDQFSIEEPHLGLTITSTSQVQVAQRSSTPATEDCPWEQVRDTVATSTAEGDWRAREFIFDSHHVQRHARYADYAAKSFAPTTPVVAAVQDLTARIHSDFRYESRSTTISTPVEEVFQRRVGVCQDFAHLQIACLRSLGLPARYISGYLRTYPVPGKQRLVGADASHAWIAVYCGPAGWLEWDPTNNLQPQTDHITVGWGRDYADVCPIQGVFVGGGQHSMAVSVDVQSLAANETVVPR